MRVCLGQYSRQQTGDVRGVKEKSKNKKGG
jgi:hypothetical protein